MASFLKLSVHLPHLDGSWQKKIIHLLRQTAISGIKDGRKDHCHPRWRSTNEVGEIRGLRLLGRLMQICLELCMGRISSSKFVPFGWASCSHHVHGECIDGIKWVWRCNHRLLMSNYLLLMSNHLLLLGYLGFRAELTQTSSGSHAYKTRGTFT